jgi:hypothetical protein
MLKETLIDAGILCAGQQYATLCGAASVSSRLEQEAERHDRSNFQPCSTERSLIPGVTNGGTGVDIQWILQGHPGSRAVQGVRAPARCAARYTRNFANI